MYNNDIMDNVKNENCINQQNNDFKQVEGVCNEENGESQNVVKQVFTDVKYKAPFSGKLLQVMAYVLLIFSHFYLMFIFAQRLINEEAVPDFAFTLLKFTDILKSASLPLLLLAAFNMIMNKSRNSSAL